MTYAEAVRRLLALRGGEHAGMRPGLERIETLLEALGHPERRYTLVQVGGTNGKGSVSAMLASMLRAAGRRVGLYTSPHLVSFRERIRVDGEAIAEDAVVDGVEALATLVARLDATCSRRPPRWRSTTSPARAVDVAVLEVGLGGRLDATTVGRPGGDRPHAHRPRSPGGARRHAGRDRRREGRHHPSGHRDLRAQAPEAAAAVLRRARPRAACRC